MNPFSQEQKQHSLSAAYPFGRVVQVNEVVEEQSPFIPQSVSRQRHGPAALYATISAAICSGFAPFGGQSTMANNDARHSTL